MTKKTEKEEIIAIGRGGGLAVSRIDFNSDDLSSNPIFSLQMLFEKNENKQRESEVGPLLKGDNR